MISIHQSQFLSWCPFYYKVLQSDNFIVLDDVQFQKNGVQNRNMIQSPQGASWITIPVNRDLHTAINEVTISDVRILPKILRTLESNYKKSPFFIQIFEGLSEILNRPISKLEELNNALFLQTLEWVGSQDLSVQYSSALKSGEKKDDLVIDLIKMTGDQEYLSGHGALAYMDLDKFRRENIKVYVCEFTYQPYFQQWQDRTGFVKDLSIIDLLFNQLDEAAQYIRKNGSFKRVV